MGCVHSLHVTGVGTSSSTHLQPLGCSILQQHTLAITGLQHLATATDCLQVVITAVWAVSTVVISTFGYGTLRTGAHMADTGTEHNIELIAQVSALRML